MFVVLLSVWDVWRLLTHLSWFLVLDCVDVTEKIFEMHKGEVSKAVSDVLKTLVRNIYFFILFFCVHRVQHDLEYALRSIIIDL